MRHLPLAFVIILIIAGCNKNQGTPFDQTSATIHIVFPDGHSYTYANSSAPINGDVYEYSYSPTGLTGTSPINYIVYTTAQAATPFTTGNPAYFTYTLNYITDPINSFNQNATLNTIPYFNYKNFAIDSASSDPVFLNSVINIQDTTYAYNKMVITSSFPDSTHSPYTGTVHVDLYPKWYIIGNYPGVTNYQPSTPVSIDFNFNSIQFQQ